MKPKALILHEKEMERIREEMKHVNGYRLKDLRRQLRRMEKERAMYMQYRKEAS